MSSSETHTAATSTIARAVGILVSPRSTFESVSAHPRWFGLTVLTTSVVAGVLAVFLSTSVGRQALVDQRVDLLETFGRTVGDSEYEAMLRGVGTLALQQVALTAGALPLVGLGIAALAYVTLGSASTFGQILAVVAHSGVILILRAVVVTPMNFFRESLSSPLNLGVLFPALDEVGFLAFFLGTIDLFVVWWAVVLAIGLSVLYTRPWGWFATRVFAAYGLVASVLAGARSTLTIQ
ncbi:MAG: YIP1 family protein [Vicinamibacterales bacterium]